MGNDDEKEDVVARIKAAKCKDPEFDYIRKRVLTAPEAGTVNSKAMRIMGESMLAAEKAKKILGSSDDDERARALAAKDKDPTVDYVRKKIYSAPDAGKNGDILLYCISLCLINFLIYFLI